MDNQNFEGSGLEIKAPSRKGKSFFIIVIILVVVFILGSLASAVLGRYFSSGQATLTWASKNVQGLAGYKIYYGNSPRTVSCPPGGYSNSVDAGNNPTYQFNNLRVGSTYYFSVAPYYQVPVTESKSGTESGCFLPEISKKISAPNFWEFLKSHIGAL